MILKKKNLFIVSIQVKVVENNIHCLLTSRVKSEFKIVIKKIDETEIIGQIFYVSINFYSKILIFHLINGPNKQTKYKQNRRLDQVTDDLVVDETDICPFDPFLFVLLLFRRQRQLDEEDLLQLLIHVVNAELPESVLFWSNISKS